MRPLRRLVGERWQQFEMRFWTKPCRGKNCERAAKHTVHLTKIGKKRLGV